MLSIRMYWFDVRYIYGASLFKSNKFTKRLFQIKKNGFKTSAFHISVLPEKGISKY